MNRRGAVLLCRRTRYIQGSALADKLSNCDCLSELSRLLWRAATSCVFQHFSLFVVSQGRGPVLASRILTSFNSQWIKCFKKRHINSLIQSYLLLGSVTEAFYFRKQAVVPQPCRLFGKMQRATE